MSSASKGKYNKKSLKLKVKGDTFVYVQKGNNRNDPKIETK